MTSAQNLKNFILSSYQIYTYFKRNILKFSKLIDNDISILTLEDRKIQLYNRSETEYLQRNSGDDRVS